MSENYGVALNQRNMQSLQLVTGATHFAKTWLDPSKWEQRFTEFQDYIDKLAADLEDKQRKQKSHLQYIVPTPMLRNSESSLWGFALIENNSSLIGFSSKSEL